MKKACLMAAWLVGMAPLTAAVAVARVPEIHGYVQTWWTVREELENGVRQAGSEDMAAQTTGGFSLRRARLSVADTLGSSRLRYRLEILLEENARLTDCYLAGRLVPGWELIVGQQKIPSTYESLQSSATLDFVERSLLSERIADWSLSRTPYISPYMGNRALLRDTGLGLRAAIGPVRCFAMAGNGLGANLFIGGKQRKEFLYGNAPTDLFYGLRVDAEVRPGLTVGGHATWNRHDNSLFNDTKTVIDLHRWSWSVDLGWVLPQGVVLHGMYAAGAVDDDYYRDRRTNYEYQGYELKALAWLVPDRVQAGLRFDRYEDEFNQAGNRVVERHWTAGVNAPLGPGSRLQLNYVWKDIDEPYVPDLDDDLLLLSAQLTF